MQQAALLTLGVTTICLLYDHLGSYTVAFHVAGIAPIAGALIMLLIPKEVKYDLPDQVWFVSNIPYGSLVSGKRLIKTTKDIRSSYSVNAGVDVTTQKFGFSASGSYTKTQSTLLKNTRNVEFMAASFSGRRVDLQHTSSLTLGEQAEPTTFAQPWLYSTKLNRISDLVRDATKRASLNQAISDYVMRTYLTVELRRVLQMLPFTYTELFLKDDNNHTRLIKENKIMEPVNFECPGGKSITEVQSWHSDWHDDRTWAFRCSYLPKLYSLDAQKNFYCWWTGYKNAIMDDMKVVATASRQIIRGVAGDHSDWHE
nr:hypothetical protein BaRGS_010027 [Batillaria attramentaria]